MGACEAELPGKTREHQTKQGHEYQDLRFPFFDDDDRMTEDDKNSRTRIQSQACDTGEHHARTQHMNSPLAIVIFKPGCAGHPLFSRLGAGSQGTLQPAPPLPAHSPWCGTSIAPWLCKGTEIGVRQ